MYLSVYQGCYAFMLQDERIGTIISIVREMNNKAR